MNDVDERLTGAGHVERVDGAELMGAEDPMDAEPLEELSLVYCGGCNPHIDRAGVAAEVKDGREAHAGTTLYLSGCPRACASGHRLTLDDTAAVVVAGPQVDGVPTSPDAIGAAVRAKLKE